MPLRGMRRELDREAVVHLSARYPPWRPPCPEAGLQRAAGEAAPPSARPAEGRQGQGAAGGGNADGPCGLRHREGRPCPARPVASGGRGAAPGICQPDECGVRDLPPVIRARATAASGPDRGGCRHGGRPAASGFKPSQQSGRIPMSGRASGQAPSPGLEPSVPTPRPSSTTFSPDRPASRISPGRTDLPIPETSP